MCNPLKNWDALKGGKARYNNAVQYLKILLGAEGIFIIQVYFSLFVLIHNFLGLSYVLFNIHIGLKNYEMIP